MSTFVYMTRCDGCGHCVDICPSDIMHIDETIRRAKNIEPNFCWECYSCVKACPNHAIDVRGYADFAPMGHSVRVRREEEKGTISWKIKFRNGTEKDLFLSGLKDRPKFTLKPNVVKEIQSINLSQIPKYLVHRYRYEIHPQIRISDDFPTYLQIEPTSTLVIQSISALLPSLSLVLAKSRVGSRSISALQVRPQNHVALIQSEPYSIPDSANVNDDSIAQSAHLCLSAGDIAR